MLHPPLPHTWRERLKERIAFIQPHHHITKHKTLFVNVPKFSVLKKVFEK